jgi:hypothetical protein
MRTATVSRVTTSSSGPWSKPCCCGAVGTSPAATPTGSSCGSCSANATPGGRPGWPRSWPCCGRSPPGGWRRASGCGCGWRRAAPSAWRATPTRCRVGSSASGWRPGCTPSGSRSGTPRGRWKRCPGCGGGASTGSTTGTSSTGWCASRGRSPTTATRRTCSPAAASAWPTTPSASSGRSGRPRSTCGSSTWRLGRARPASRRPWRDCWPRACHRRRPRWRRGCVRVTGHCQ